MSKVSPERKKKSNMSSPNKENSITILTKPSTEQIASFYCEPNTNRSNDDLKGFFDVLLDDLGRRKVYPIQHVYYLPRLIDHCVSKKNMMVTEEKFVQAQDYEDLFHLLNRFLDVHKSLKGKMEIWNQCNSEKLMDEKKIMQIESQRDEEIKNIKMQLESAIESMESSHQAEMIKFDEETNGEVPSTYIKNSSRYLNLKTILENMVKSKRFEEAAGIQSMIEKMEPQEQEKAKKKFLRARDIMKQQIIADHKQHISCILQNYDRKINSTISKYNARIDNILLHLSQLKPKINELSRTIQTESSSFEFPPITNQRSFSSVSPMKSKSCITKPSRIEKRFRF